MDESSEVVLHNPEQEKIANNPFRIAATKLYEASEKTDISQDERDFLARKAQEFDEFVKQARIRREFLEKQGLDPETNPEIYYKLLQDPRNDIFLPAGVVLNEAVLETQTPGTNLSIEQALNQSGIQLALEALQFLENGESIEEKVKNMQGEVKYAKQQIRDNKMVTDIAYQPETGQRITCWGIDMNPDRSGEVIAYLHSPLLGNGVLAGVGLRIGLNADYQVDNASDKIIHAFVRPEAPPKPGVEAVEAEARAALRCSY